MKKTIRFIGVIGALLGGLWLLQGLGVVHVRPILCFADCTAIPGASSVWATIGFLLLSAGIIAIFSSRRPQAPR